MMKEMRRKRKIFYMVQIRGIFEGKLRTNRRKIMVQNEAENM